MNKKALPKICVSGNAFVLKGTQMEERNYKVYCHIHPDGRKYVGITKQENLNHRWSRGNGYRYNKYFYRSIKKVGWDSFKHIILAKNLTLNEAYKLEMFFIQKYKSYIRKYGFNLAMGGLSNIPNKEAKEKMRKNATRLFGKDNPFYGKKHTQETKKLISQNHDYSKQSGRYAYQAKAVICLDTGDLFECAETVGKFYGVNGDRISPKCRSLTSSWRGLHFMYYKDFLKKMQQDPLFVQEYMHKQPKQKMLNIPCNRLKFGTIFDYERLFKYKHKQNLYTSLS